MFTSLKRGWLLFAVIIGSIYQTGCSKSGSDNNSTPVTPVNPTPTPTLTYQLVWSDEFNTNGMPDTSKWGYDVGGNGWGNNELQYYTNARPENVRIENGSLVIEARKENYSGKAYTSARLLTKGKADWQYGKFEIRAKLPRGRGTWPALWLLAATNPLNWPNDGELDIMEEVGYNANVIVGSAHNKTYFGGNSKSNSKFISSAQDSFHVYTLEWTEFNAIWSIDGVEFHAYQNPGNGTDTWPYQKKFFFIMNTAIGGDWGGAQGIDDSIFPQSFLIDYVRVYQKK